MDSTKNFGIILVRFMRFVQLLITLAAIAASQCVDAQGTLSTDNRLPPPPDTKNTRGRALYAPRPKLPAEVVARNLRGAGVCVVYLNPDGTVLRAKMLQSTGQPILDKLTIDTFSKWRFVPGAFKKVKIPITYLGKYPKPEKT
jgi:TonB family protein